jgi:RNA polymerase sigma-70 factor, ECF subfamily
MGDEMSAATAAPRAADRTWFAEEVKTLLPELYGAALRLCRDRVDAEDLVAESLTKAWQKLSSLQRREAFRGWLFRILTNTYISQYRARDRGPAVESYADDFSLFERLHQPILLWWGNPEQDFLTGLLREDLTRALDRLPDPFHTVVVLVDVRGMAYREVAEALDVPMGTVRSRLARGRSLLQHELWENARDAGLRSTDRPDEGEPS